MDKSSVKGSVRNGNYAFQEYATLNWIQHAKLLQNYDRIEALVALLHSRHLEDFSSNGLASIKRDFEDRGNSKSAAIDRYQEAYQRIDNICAKEDD